MSMLSAQSSPLFISFAVATKFPAALLLAGCTVSGASRLSMPTYEFACLANKAFAVQVDGDRALVGTGTSPYTLMRRNSSIGRKYASGDVTLILDEDRGVLVGAEGGPFHGCRQR